MLGMLCLCQRPVTAHGCSQCPLWQPCAATGRWHYSIVRAMTPWNHALRVSFVRELFAVVCVLFALLQRFATLFEICGYDCCDSSIEICLARQSIYLVLRRGCWGRANKPRSWLFRTAVLESASALSLPLAFYSWEHRPTRLIIPIQDLAGLNTARVSITQETMTA